MIENKDWKNLRELGILIEKNLKRVGFVFAHTTQCLHHFFRLQEKNPVKYGIQKLICCSGKYLCPVCATEKPTYQHVFQCAKKLYHISKKTGTNQQEVIFSQKIMLLFDTIGILELN